MPDKYQSFAELAEQENGNFLIHSRLHVGATAVVAPHGGKIEPGTLELARAIASDDLSFYAFEGRKKAGNRDLHITSHRFDEPKCIDLIAASPRVVTIHGEKGSEQTVYVGGLDEELGGRIRISLEAVGFTVKMHSKANLKGLHNSNVCNRCPNGRGVQLELTKALRDSLIGSAERFHKFVRAVRSCIM